MSHFKLSLRHVAGFQWTENIDAIMELTRKYRNMEVVLGIRESAEKFIQVAQRHGPFIRALHIISGDFTASQFQQILKSLPLLEVLKCTSCNISSDESLSRSSTENLKEVELTFSSWNILDYLPTAKMKSLKLIQGGGKSVKGFLSLAFELKSLTIDKNAFDSCFCDHRWTTYRFQLELLEVVTFSTAPNAETENNFSSFLTKQQSLRKLIFLWHPSSFVVQNIFTALINLEHLVIDLTSFPNCWHFYWTLQPLMKLKYLEIYAGNLNYAAIEGIVKKCPNLEVLTSHSNKATGEFLKTLFANLSARLLLIADQGFDKKLENEIVQA